MSSQAAADNTEDLSKLVEDLQDLLVSDGGFVMLPDRAYDEVHPGILIGEASIARNKDKIKAVGITHVLNCAEGKTSFHVQTGAQYYGDLVTYYGFEATDVASQKLIPIFKNTAGFISSALAMKGKVLVHCREGVSRSAAVVLAYLMERCDMSLKDAIRQVHARRNVYPNEGFLEQLIKYERELLAAKKTTNGAPKETGKEADAAKETPEDSAKEKAKEGVEAANGEAKEGDKEEAAEL